MLSPFCATPRLLCKGITQEYLAEQKVFKKIPTQSSDAKCSEAQLLLGVLPKDAGLLKKDELLEEFLGELKKMQVADHRGDAPALVFLKMDKPQVQNAHAGKCSLRQTGARRPNGVGRFIKLHFCVTPYPKVIDRMGSMVMAGVSSCSQ